MTAAAISGGLEFPSPDSVERFLVALRADPFCLFSERVETAQASLTEDSVHLIRIGYGYLPRHKWIKSSTDKLVS